jgi:hypothetical protein
MLYMRKMLFSSGLALIIAISGISISHASPADFGAAGAEADQEYTLEEMLQYAIEDEFLAQAEYEIIIEEYGLIRPFSNVIRAEGRHISALLPLFEEYDYEIPSNDAKERTVIPDSLEEIFSVGVEAEIKNIEMYKSFLEEELPDDVRRVFENLMRASESHLKAFERSEARNTGGSNMFGGNSQSKGFAFRYGTK